MNAYTLDEDKQHTLTPVEYLSLVGSEIQTKKKSPYNSGLFGQGTNNYIEQQINLHLFMNGLALPPTSTNVGNSNTRGNDSLWSSSQNTGIGAVKPHNFQPPQKDSMVNESDSRFNTVLQPKSTEDHHK